MGTVEHIHIAPERAAPVHAVESIELVKGLGIIGDRNQLAPGEWDDTHIGEELTLVEAESLENLARDHDIHLNPGDTRRNVTTRGISLNDLVGKRFRVGEVIAEGVELCEPCTHLQSAIPTIPSPTIWSTSTATNQPHACCWPSATSAPIHSTSITIDAMPTINQAIAERGVVPCAATEVEVVIQFAVFKKTISETAATTHATM
jgi:hypothetical protein